MCCVCWELSDGLERKNIGENEIILIDYFGNNELLKYPKILGNMKYSRITRII